MRTNYCFNSQDCVLIPLSPSLVTPPRFAFADEDDDDESWIGYNCVSIGYNSYPPLIKNNKKKEGPYY